MSKLSSFTLAAALLCAAPSLFASDDKLDRATLRGLRAVCTVVELAGAPEGFAVNKNSLQFEIGPLSEASIGNVGMRPETTGWVDHVVTPTGAFGLIVAEDALDRFFVKWAEEKVGNRVFRLLLRLAMNPGRTLSNTASGRVPWHRDGRPLDWR